jgi:hypothetical protein
VQLHFVIEAFLPEEFVKFDIGIHANRASRLMAPSRRLATVSIRDNSSTAYVVYDLLRRGDQIIDGGVPLARTYSQALVFTMNALCKTRALGTKNLKTYHITQPV